jgi:hypothetical protein
MFAQLFMLVFILLYSVLALYLLWEGTRQVLGWRPKRSRSN